MPNVSKFKWIIAVKTLALTLCCYKYNDSNIKYFRRNNYHIRTLRNTWKLYT